MVIILDAMIQPTRIRQLNDKSPDKNGRYVLYWMQASQRTRFNHALEHAATLAGEEFARPLVVCFGLMDDYPEANERHYAFMLQGLSDVQANLSARGVGLVVKHGHPQDVALHYARRACIVVCDRGYTRHQRRWRDHVADHAPVRVVQVESDVVVPVEQTSDKHESAARTIRPKLHRLWDSFFVPLAPQPIAHPALKLRVDGALLEGDIDVGQPLLALQKLKLDRSVGAVSAFTGGENAAMARLNAFIRDRLPGYKEGRNEPAAGHTSTLSAYLHFGQISPLEMALRAMNSSAPREDVDAFVEELVVRRELAVNFVQFNPNYDRYEGLPQWARKTLEEHAGDRRYHVYTRQQLEAAQTHDRYWNAAQREMNATGFMHNYMRMYWGKKVLEWGRTPQEAFADLLYLNNKLFLCGRDPNGWANVAWVFGLHDRPWGPRRPVFGTVRYMNDRGLERKFDMQAYVDKVDALVAQASGS